MKVILLIILAILALAAGLFTAVALYKWQIYIHYKNNKLNIELRGFGFKRTLIDRDFSVKKEKAEEKKQNTKEKSSGLSDRLKADKERIYNAETGYNHQGLTEVIAEYKEIFNQVKDAVYGFLGDMRYKMEIPLLRIKLDFGTGDPAHTGMVYGGIWGAVGTAYPIARRYVDMAYPVLDITPDFNGKRFDVEVKSIIKVKPAHIINALLKRGIRSAITYCIKNFKKGSVKNG